MRRHFRLNVVLLASAGLLLVACEKGSGTRLLDAAVVGSGGASGLSSGGTGGAGGATGGANGTAVATGGSTSVAGRDGGSTDARAPDAQGAPDTNSGASGGTSGSGGTSNSGGTIGSGGVGSGGRGGTAGQSGNTGNDASPPRTGGTSGTDAPVADGPPADLAVRKDTEAAVDSGAAHCQEPPTIFDLPVSFGVPHASKGLLACGVYIIASSVVADAALLRAQQILQVELHKVVDDLPGVDAKLTSSKSRLVILGRNEDQSVYWPTASGRRSFCSWPDQKGMIEDTTLEEELTSTQRSLLMTTVHETGHFTQFVLYLYNKPLYDRSVSAFDNCTQSLYNSYDLQNAQEFFAGDTLRWFDLNPSDLAVSDASTLSQRDQLKKYSTTMYQIMSETFYPAAIP